MGHIHNIRENRNHRIADVTPGAGVQTEARGQSMMKVSRSIISGRWCSITVLIVFAAMLAVCISPAMVSALTCDCNICVNESGWWRDGGAFNANATTPIQAAVTNATAGETIYVWNGSYGENVDVDKRVTLAGEGADVVSVSAKSTDDHVFDVTVNWVNISGFNVTGAIGDWKAGIYLNNASHCNISDNNCANNGDGVVLVSSSNNTLTNNTASSNKWGIYLESSSNNMLSNNNANSNNRDGIYLESSSNNTLSNNNALNNQDYGIILHSSSNNNTLTNNTANSNSCGIILHSSSNNNTLTNNTANSNSNAGIWLESSSNNTLTNNNALNNQDYGIILHSSSNNNTLTNNTANSNSCGIILHSSSNNNTLTNNTANSNSDTGIYLEFSSNNTLSNNTANSNNQDGIYLESSSNNTLTNNAANSNSDTGIWLESSSNNTLSNNNASSNEWGIWLESSSNNTLSNNNASSNEWGIWLESSSNNTLTNNTANSNSDTGIWLKSSSNNTLSNNNASSNEWGIWLESSSNNTLSNNNASSNEWGIYMHSSSNNTLSNNTASDNNHYDIILGDSRSNTFTDNTLNGTTVSFTYGGDVSLKGVGLPAAGAPGWYSIGKFINAINQCEGAWIILNFSYSDSDFTGAMNESNLTVQKYSGTWSEDGWNGTRYLDPANNIVGVNITSFGVFAPMTTGVPALHHITVEPGSALLNIDEPPKSQTFAVTGRSKHTDPIPDLMFGWSNADTSVGWLNKSTGTVVNFTAEHVGIARITAMNGSVTSDQVRVTVNGETNSTTVTNGTAIVTSGDVNVTCDFGENVTGLINITAIGNTINSSEVNQSNPCYGLGSGDTIVSGVTINVNDSILGELAAGNGTIHIRMGYNTTTLTALSITDEHTLAIWKYNSTTETWVKQSSTISTISKRCVYVDVDHLCIFALVGSTTTGGTGTNSPGGSGTSGTSTSTVTAAKTSTTTATATATATDAPPGERMSPMPAETKKPATAETTVPMASATPTKPKHGLPGFTAAFAGCGVLAAVWVVMWQRA